MSGHGIHVHGAHDHAVEHEAHKGGLGQQVAIFSAVLATVGAIVSFFGGDTQNKAMLYKNEAVLERAEATDQWNFYQAKSSKQNLAELGGVLATGAAADRYKSEVARYQKEKDEIMAKATELEKRSEALEVQSEASMHVHHRWAQATTLIQISIALAAITLLTRSRGLQYLAYGAAAGSIGLGTLALMHI